jgi:quercetin dioxygenase-like cupin family protein
MAPTEERLRQHPAERFAGPEHRLVLRDEIAALRQEAHPPIDGHRQMTIFHRGPARLVLFAFERGGRLSDYIVPGFVTIQVLDGALRVETERASYELQSGDLLILDPETRHNVEAVTQADMLLGVTLL